MSVPIEYFKRCCDEYKGFVGREFTCEDLNLVAFHSLDTFRNWYGQEPGPVGGSYRDEGFYTRELARASMEARPQRILEIGTSIGIGTLLLRILNPEASIISIDNREMIPAGDGNEYPAGFLALTNGSHHTQIIGDSKAQKFGNVDLIFIDGDHSEEGVWQDSLNALTWASPNSAIIWHDFNDRHPGVIRSVNQFCCEKGLLLNSPDDSSTAWALINNRSK